MAKDQSRMGISPGSCSWPNAYGPRAIILHCEYHFRANKLRFKLLVLPWSPLNWALKEWRQVDFGLCDCGWVASRRHRKYSILRLTSRARTSYSGSCVGPGRRKIRCPSSLRCSLSMTVSVVMASWKRADPDAEEITSRQGQKVPRLRRRQYALSLLQKALKIAEDLN